MLKSLYKIKEFLWIANDIFIAYLSLYLMLAIRYGFEFDRRVWNLHFLPFTIIFIVWVIVFYISNLYNSEVVRDKLEFYSSSVRAITLAGITAIGFFYFVPNIVADEAITPKTNLLITIAIFSLLFVATRNVLRMVFNSRRFSKNTLIIGEKPEFKPIVEEILKNDILGYKFIKNTLDYNLSQNEINIENIIKNENIETIILAANPHLEQNLGKNLYNWLPYKIDFWQIETFYEKIFRKIPVAAIKETWFLENLSEGSKEAFDILKRITDLIAASFLFIFFIAAAPFIMFLIKWGSAGPVFYKQKRVGKNDREFTILKFRTMKQNAEIEGKAEWAMPNDPRITKIGKYLRILRLDELPQVLNIFRDEMSFVGPRPERPNFVKDFEEKIPFYKTRLLVKPGLTGWAQINFRYAASVEENYKKLQYDLYYIKNRSIILDLAIILKTINIVLTRGGQ